MKGVTSTIALIVLLLITVALAGAAWTYLSLFTSSIIENTYDIRDTFCINGDTAVIMLANTGTLDLDVSDISVIDHADGTAIAGDWYDTSGANVITDIPVGEMGRWQETTGACSPSCSYRVVGGSSKAQTANIKC